MKRTHGNRRRRRVRSRRKTYLALVVFIVFLAAASMAYFSLSHPLRHQHSKLRDSAAWYVTTGPQNSSAWMIIDATSAPYLVRTNNTGTIPEYPNLSALNQTKIGTYCTAVNTTEYTRTITTTTTASTTTSTQTITTTTNPSEGTCEGFQWFQQTGWYWDSVNDLLYVHYVGEDPVNISVYQYDTTSGTGSTGSSQSAQAGAPSIIGQVINAQSAGTYQEEIQVINNESDLQATITALNFSSNQFEVSYPSSTLPLAIAPSATQKFGVTVVVPKNITAGSYYINGTATVFETSSIGLGTNFVVNFAIPVTIGESPKNGILTWTMRYYEWIIAVVVASVVVVGALAYFRED